MRSSVLVLITFAIRLEADSYFKRFCNSLPHLGIGTLNENAGKAPTCEAVFAFKTKNQGNAINLCETLSMNYQLNNVTFGEKTTCIYTSNTFCEDTIGGYYIGRCVQFVKERMTLNGATAYCSRNRRTLLSIIDEAEIRWTTVLSPSGPSVWVSNKITDRNVKGFLSLITPLKRVVKESSEALSLRVWTGYNGARAGTLELTHPDTKLPFFCTSLDAKKYIQYHQTNCEMMETLGMKVLWKHSHCYIITPGVFAQDYGNSFSGNPAMYHHACNFIDGMNGKAMIPASIYEQMDAEELMLKHTFHHVNVPAVATHNINLSFPSSENSYHFLQPDGNVSSVLTRAFKNNNPHQRCGGDYQCNTLDFTVGGLETAPGIVRAPLICELGFSQLDIHVKKCPIGWQSFVRFNGNTWCLKLQRGHMNWYEAQRQCEKEGAKLSGIESQEELDAIKKVLSGLNLPAASVWLGGMRVPNTNRFEWQDGSTEKDTFVTNFAPGEPNNAELQEDCLQMYFGNGSNPSHERKHGKMNDFKCHSTGSNVDEWDKIHGWACGKLASS